MGSGYRTFAVSEVLTAANVMNYLMDQAVMSFADSTARDAAVTSPEEGMVAYLQDTNTISVYTGAAWVDISTLISESAIDHGGLGGLADDDHTQYVLRNILTTRGDLFRRGASAIERVALGANGTVLTSDGTDAVWAASATGASVFDSDSATSGGASSVAEFTVATLTIPQNDPAAGDIYRFEAVGRLRRDAGGLTLRLKLGATTVLATTNAQFGSINNNAVNWTMHGFIVFTGTAAEIIGASLISSNYTAADTWGVLDASQSTVNGASGRGTATEDSTAGALNLVMTAQFSSSDPDHNVSMDYALMEKVSA